MYMESTLYMMNLQLASDLSTPGQLAERNLHVLVSLMRDLSFLSFLLERLFFRSCKSSFLWKSWLSIIGLDERKGGEGAGLSTLTWSRGGIGDSSELHERSMLWNIIVLISSTASPKRESSGLDFLKNKFFGNTCLPFLSSEVFRGRWNTREFASWSGCDEGTFRDEIKASRAPHEIFAVLAIICRFHHCNEDINDLLIIQRRFDTNEEGYEWG